MKISLSNNAGFTLVELLVAMVITLVGLLGLLQTATIATEQNLKNQIRDEAVNLAEEEMRALQVRPFSVISSSYADKTATSRLRGLTKQMYTVKRSSSTVSMPAANTDGKMVRVNVTWSYKGNESSHEISAVVTQ